MAEIARRALEGTLPTASPGAGFDEGPVVADVCVEGDLGFVLILHRRDDGHLADEIYHSLRDPDGGPGNEWPDCDHLGGGAFMWGFDPMDPPADEESFTTRAPAISTDSESLIYTGRDSGDEGYELVRVVELLVPTEADSLGVRTRGGAAPRHRPLSSRLALVVLLPGDRVRVRAARSTETGYTPVGEAIELTHPEHPAQAPDWL
ncbi:hypothetical protein [Streptomyces sp. ST2-7A]|uniref:hypothetical protein n=1 Tax=Streptomyces sp. ST2-7A TaxID=2907214 RepID=UPI001F219CAF|nr:hypothetical protein [Streptomyces sp. ST2-7A]MCE7081866.1 hypothetical protein [Streptomyces sp. ST2-7A]